MRSSIKLIPSQILINIFFKGYVTYLVWRTYDGVRFNETFGEIF